MNELFIQHVILAVILSALISSALEWIKGRLKKELTGTQWTLISIVVTLIVGFGYTMYYEQLPLHEAVAIVVIIVLGAQGFYQVVIDKGNKDEHTNIVIGKEDNDGNAKTKLL